MKLYVWEDPYEVSYGGALLYVVAENEEAARALAKNVPVYANTVGGKGFVLSDIKPELGEPTRILELPCAEIYEWSE